VTVTHYDASKKPGQLELIATPTHTETIIVTQQKPEKNATTTTTSLQLPVCVTTATTTSQLPVSPVHLPQISSAKNIINNNNKVVIGLSPFLQGLASSSSNNTNNPLLLPHNPHLYHSQEALNLFSSIGVPNYTESFAVDPNEILNKEKFIKSEPSTPTPKAAEFRPVFHNVRVPTTKDDLLFKTEPMTPMSCEIKQEGLNGEQPVPMNMTPPPATSHQLLLSPEVEGLSVNDIKKEVLSELFDCEPEYGGSSDDSFLESYDDTGMQYSDDSQDDFSGCLLSSGYEEGATTVAAAGQEGDCSAASGHTSNHNLDLSLKLEALSPMSSFDSEPVPQTPEFYMNKDDVFK
jgi:hypothetical protein